MFTPGTALAEEFDELKPLEGEKVVVKELPSSFANTDLDGWLKKQGWKKVVLVGYMVCFFSQVPHLFTSSRFFW